MIPPSSVVVVEVVFWRVIDKKLAAVEAKVPVAVDTPPVVETAVAASVPPPIWAALAPIALIVTMPVRIRIPADVKAVAARITTEASAVVPAEPIRERAVMMEVAAGWYQRVTLNWLPTFRLFA